MSVIYRFSIIVFLMYSVTAAAAAVTPDDGGGRGESSPLAASEYRSDFAYLVKELEGRHPNPFLEVDKKTFEAQLEGLAERSQTQDAFTTMMDLRILVAGLGDSHTSVGFYDAIFERGAFPLQFAWFGEELRVIGAEEPYSDVLGARLDAIEDTPIETVSAQIATLVPPRDNGFARKRIPWMMPYIGLHTYFGTARGDRATLTFTTMNGEPVQRVVSASLFGGAEGDLLYLSDQVDHPTWVNPNEDRFDIMFRDILYDDGVYLVQYNSAWGRELQTRFGDPESGAESASQYPSFQEFQTRILSTLQGKDIKALVFDVRANSGGSSLQGTELARRIAELPADHRPDNVFVAISDQTFSAAVINAMDFKQILNARFIGTRSGGKANHFGEVRLFVLPNSGIELPHSTNYFKYVEGEGDSLMPEIEAPHDISDLQLGRDAVIDGVREALKALN